MKIQDLYKKYDIMPQLVTHQLRVAGVGKLITESWEDTSLAEETVKTCLIHDLGNIVKFNGLTDSYWLEKQQQYRQQYGAEAHQATYAMLREAGLTKYIKYLEDEAEMYRSEPSWQTFEKASRPAMIVLYADLRVAINGIVSMQERIDDLTARYGGVRKETKWGTQLEEYIQSLTSREVKEIDEAAVAPLFDELLTYNI